MKTTIKPTRAADLVVEHIEALIWEGSLRAGEPLLPERELAERLNVSRPTLRDGLKILEERGLLTSKEGRGVKVAQLGAAAIADPLMEMISKRVETTDDYLEFRDVIESSAAAMAAKRANEVDIARVRECLDRIDHAHAQSDPELEAEADAALHMAIYEASHNLVVLQIMRVLSANLRTDVFQNRTRLFAVPQIRDLLRDQHKTIGEAILARDDEAARNAAHTHIAYLRDAVRAVREAEAKLDISLRRLNSGGLVSRKSAE